MTISNKVNYRTIPYKHLEHHSTDLQGYNLALKVIILTKDYLYKIAYFFGNCVISAANILQLYKFEKAKPVPFSINHTLLVDSNALVLPSLNILFLECARRSYLPYAKDSIDNGIFSLKFQGLIDTIKELFMKKVPANRPELAIIAALAALPPAFIIAKIRLIPALYHLDCVLSLLETAYSAKKTYKGLKECYKISLKDSSKAKNEAIKQVANFGLSLFRLYYSFYPIDYTNILRQTIWKDYTNALRQKIWKDYTLETHTKKENIAKYREISSELAKLVTYENTSSGRKSVITEPNARVILNYLGPLDKVKNHCRKVLSQLHPDKKGDQEAFTLANNSCETLKNANIHTVISNNHPF
jgi:hypothetical protein